MFLNVPRPGLTGGDNPVPGASRPLNGGGFCSVLCRDLYKLTAGAFQKGIGLLAGFTVKTSQLHAASEDVAGLQGRCDTIGGDSVTALAQMSANAGHPGLESALAAAAGQASNAFSAAIAVYQHISNSYAASAVNYDAVESGNLAIAKAIQAGLGF